MSANQDQANTAQPRFAGAGQSRDMTTQPAEPKLIPLLQEAMTQEGGLYTLIFGIIPPSDPTVPFACEAQIRFSEEGNHIQRRISLVRGASIACPGRLIDVKIIDTTPTKLPISNDNTPGAGSKYTVSVIAERGIRAPTLPPTLYEGIASVGSHADETIAIPSDAGAVSLKVSAIVNVANPAAKPNLVVSFISGTGVFLSYDPTVELGFVPIPPGATSVKIHNADGTNPALVALTWGIDG